MQHLSGVYLGYDEREPKAYDVARQTLVVRGGIYPTPLDARRLRDRGLLWRPEDRRDTVYDLVSNAACSTDFAITRFLVPILAQRGWWMFADCDVVFLRNIREVAALLDPKYAVMVVKHDHNPIESVKMDGQAQLAYPRKNWSSVMVFNTDHPAHKRLTLHDVNTRPGRDLHAFYWLDDSEIGALPPEYNWLVGAQPKPAKPVIAHFTLGGPFFPDWPGAEHDNIWLEAAKWE